MDVKQLKSLVAVDDHGSFSAAADALDTVQSNVSAHISKLENELNAVLIDRRDGTLTEKGQIVVKRARSAISELEAIYSDLSSLSTDVRGRVRVGLIGTTARWLIPLLTAQIGHDHPHMKLHLSEGTSSALHRWLHEGVIDLAILNTPIYASDIHFRVLFEEQMVLAVPPDYDIAKKDQIYVTDLDSLEILAPPKGNWFRDELDAVAANSGARLKTKAEIDGLRLIAALATDGFGPAIVPATAISPHLGDRIVTVPIVDVAPRKVGIARRKNQIESSAVRGFTISLETLLQRPGVQLPKGVMIGPQGKPGTTGTK